MGFDLQDIFGIFSHFWGYLVLGIVSVHLLVRFVFPKKPLKLNKDSFIVITGACTGIGRQMALQIARLYHSCILVIDRRKDLFDQISQQLIEAGATCQCIYADLASDSSVEHLNTYLLNRNQPINLFIYNAGIVIPKKTWQISQEEHNLVMKVNYFTPTLMLKKLEPLLMNNHVAVTVSMVAIIHGGVDVATYSASKHALYGYLSSLRQQYKKCKKNITLSMGCPYAINTTMFEGFKTTLDSIIWPLDEKYVGQRLVKEFIQKKEVSFLYQYEALFFKLFDFLPTEIADQTSIHLNHSQLKQSYKPTSQQKRE